MISTKIIKIASITNNAGLKNEFTHKTSMRNSLCGDFIKLEIIADQSKIKSMRYETDACILCEASASLLSRKIRNIKINDLAKEIKKLKSFKKNSSFILPKKFKEFRELINRENINRFDCVILPMDAFLKAFKIKL